MSIISAVAAGLAVIAAVAHAPTVDTAPAAGVSVAAQHAAVQSGIEVAR